MNTQFPKIDTPELKEASKDLHAIFLGARDGCLKDRKTEVHVFVAAYTVLLGITFEEFIIYVMRHQKSETFTETLTYLIENVSLDHMPTE